MCYLIPNMCVQCPVPSVPNELPSVYVEILVPVNVCDFHVNFYPMILPCGTELGRGGYFQTGARKEWKIRLQN